MLILCAGFMCCFSKAKKGYKPLPKKRFRPTKHSSFADLVTAAGAAMERTNDGGHGWQVPPNVILPVTLTHVKMDSLDPLFPLIDRRFQHHSKFLSQHVLDFCLREREGRIQTQSRMQQSHERYPDSPPVCFGRRGYRKRCLPVSSNLLFSFRICSTSRAGF